MEFEARSNVGLLFELVLSDLLSLSHHVLVLDTHETTTIRLEERVVIVVARLEGLLEGVEVLHIFLSHIGDGDAGGGFQVNELSEVVLALSHAEGNTLLSAESWQESHELNWLDVTGDDDKLGLALLDEGGDVVETEFEVDWLWSNVISLVATLSGLGLGSESLLLLRLGLWGVLGEEFDELVLLVWLDGVGENVENWWALESHEEYSLLPLDSDILWPFDVPSQVPSWLDVSSDSEVSGTLLEERSASSRLGCGSG